MSTVQTSVPAQAPKAQAPKTPKAPKNDATQQSTKPGDPAPEAKKEKPERIYHPALDAKPGEDGKLKPTVKLKDWPADFDPKIHKQLKRGHFENEAPLLRKRAEEYREKAAKLDVEASDCEKNGGKAKGKVKKLRSMMDRFAELRAELEAEGTDTSEFAKMFEDAFKNRVSAEKTEEPAKTPAA